MHQHIAVIVQPKRAAVAAYAVRKINGAVLWRAVYVFHSLNAVGVCAALLLQQWERCLKLLLGTCYELFHKQRAFGFQCRCCHIACVLCRGYRRSPCWFALEYYFVGVIAVGNYYTTNVHCAINVYGVYRSGVFVAKAVFFS